MGGSVTEIDMRKHGGFIQQMAPNMQRLERHEARITEAVESGDRSTLTIGRELWELWTEGDYLAVLDQSSPNPPDSPGWIGQLCQDSGAKGSQAQLIAYATKSIGIQRSRVKQALKYVALVDLLGGVTAVPPPSERSLRPLTRLLTDDHVDHEVDIPTIWEKACAEAANTDDTRLYIERDGERRPTATLLRNECVEAFPELFQPKWRSGTVAPRNAAEWAHSWVTDALLDGMSDDDILAQVREWITNDRRFIK